ncbi:MAG: GNAT family N-acetyltransferase [Planctomycetota bacterium]|nr:MAG: GNAT family N-acetyltransferase [Planctomycetota bacterium]
MTCSPPSRILQAIPNRRLRTARQAPAMEKVLATARMLATGTELAMGVRVHLPQSMRSPARPIPTRPWSAGLPAYGWVVGPTRSGVAFAEGCIMSVDWRIRPATEGDVESLTEFNSALARETENKLLDQEVLRQGVRRALALAPEVRYWVAEQDGRPIGCLMVTREWSDWRNGWVAWLQSVYVIPAARGRGVFGSLLQTAIADAQTSPDVVGMRLYVEEDNRRAQEVYRRSGFVDARYRVYEQMFGTTGDLK